MDHSSEHTDPLYSAVGALLRWLTYLLVDSMRNVYELLTFEVEAMENERTNEEISSRSV